MSFLKIGTRGSPLALVQAHMVQAELARTHGVDAAEIDIVQITTSGDKIQDKSLALAGGKGLFTKEIEHALIEGSIDLAVHSMKDVPTQSQPELMISCVLPREDVRDAFICHTASSLEDLPEGAVVGTSSLRRQAQVKHMRPDLETVSFRGNVDTRLSKLKDGVVDATLLASAGLKRLGKSDLLRAYLPTDKFLPAVAQGAIGIEVRKNDDKTKELLSPLNHPETHICVLAERAFLRVMDGSCRTPIAALAQIDGRQLHIKGQIIMPDGSVSYTDEASGDIKDAELIGENLGKMLREKAGPGFMADVESLSQSSL